MSTTPPPFSPREARWQARARRAQWRAAARAQKEYSRRYWRGMRRPSMVGPVVLLAIGIVALLMELGRLDSMAFWAWYAHWWPLLLIAMGLLLLAEHFLDMRTAWPVRRSRGGLVWLVILLVVLGWAAHQRQGKTPFSWGFSGMDSGDFWNWMGPEHEKYVQIDETLVAAEPTVSITNPAGDVAITAAADGQMHVRAHERVRRNSQKLANAIFDELKPVVATTATGAAVTVPEKPGARVDLTLEVPPNTTALVNAGHGDVAASGLKNVEVTARQGDVTLDSLAGDGRIHLSQGDFTAQNVQGSVAVDGSGGDVTLSAVKGSVSMEGEFHGDIHVEQVRGAVRFHSSRTTVEIPHLLGSLALDGSDLSISQAMGPLRVLTHSKDLDLSQIAGDAQIADGNGDISLIIVNPLGDVQVTNEAGDVVVTMPANANFTVTGSASADEDVQSAFPLKVKSESGRQTVQGRVGEGGPRLELRADHGELELRKGENVTLPLALPAAATVGVKHFRMGPGQKAQETEQ